MKLFFLLFLCAYYAPVVISQRPTPNLASVAKKLRITHFDCGEMNQNKHYALNQVEQCNVAPENLEVVITTTPVCRSYTTESPAIFPCHLKPVRQ